MLTKRRVSGQRINKKKMVKDIEAQTKKADQLEAATIFKKVKHPVTLKVYIDL